MIRQVRISSKPAISELFQLVFSTRLKVSPVSAIGALTTCAANFSTCKLNSISRRGFSRAMKPAKPSTNAQILSKDILDNTDFENMQSRRFTDRLRIQVQGGTGGPGCYSFIRTRVITTGHADGGNGGQGGDVYVEAQKARPADLSYFKKSKFIGNEGKSGKSKKQNGEAGNPISIFVPVGTQVFKITESNKDGIVKEKKEMLTRKPLADREKVLVTRGGYGGLGTVHEDYASDRQSGLPGQIAHIELLLSIPNDVSLMGFRGSGKTTLLGSLTRMVGKIQDEGPATFHPSLGILKFLDERQVSILDLPPISLDDLTETIEVADSDEVREVPAKKTYAFTHHMASTKLILFVLDASSKDLQDHVIALLRFVREYRLDSKRVCFVATKSDLLADGEADQLKAYFHRLKAPCILISARERNNLDELVHYLRKTLVNIKTN